MFLLKAPHTDILGITGSELQDWGSSLKNTRDIHGGTGFRMKARGAAFSQVEVLKEAIIPFLRPLSTHRASRHEPDLSLHQLG